MALSVIRHFPLNLARKGHGASKYDRELLAEAAANDELTVYQWIAAQCTTNRQIVQFTIASPTGVGSDVSGEF